MKPMRLEMPVIGKETPVGREWRELLEAVGIRTYDRNTF